MKQLIHLASNSHLNLEIYKCQCCGCIQLNYHAVAFIMKRKEFMEFAKVVKSLINQHYTNAGSETSYINFGKSMRLTLSLPDLFELDKCVREALHTIHLLEMDSVVHSNGWTPASN